MRSIFVYNYTDFIQTNNDWQKRITYNQNGYGRPVVWGFLGVGGWEGWVDGGKHFVDLKICLKNIVFVEKKWCRDKNSAAPRSEFVLIPAPKKPIAPPPPL